MSEHPEIQGDPRCGAGEGRSVAQVGLRARLHAAFRSGGVSLMRRTLPAEVEELIGAVPADLLPELVAAGTPRTVADLVRRALAGAGFGSPRLIEWLGSDIENLASDFASAAGVASVGLQLAPCIDDRPPRPGLDGLGHRLVTAYRDVGTAWLPPRVLALLPPGWPVPSAVGLTRPGEAAQTPRVLGSFDPGPPGHRRSSFPRGKRRPDRLLLAIDDHGSC